MASGERGSARRSAWHAAVGALLLGAGGLALVFLAGGCGGSEEGSTAAAPGGARKEGPASEAKAGGTGRPPATPQRAEPSLAERARAVLGVIPPVAEPEGYERTPAKISLGRMLYFEGRLSVNGKISCNSCHPLDRFGADGEPTSPGHDGTRGERNSPSTYHAAFHVAQFWDGRAKDVEEQAKAPILNPIEMGMPSEEAVLEMLRGIPTYVEAFAAAFPGEATPLTYENLAIAIGAFARGLVTPSRFDLFLEGDEGALTAHEKEGLRLFLDVGCTTCHQGATIGGTMFQKLGVVHPYPTEDPGRFAVTGNEADRFVFKVPSLRNVARTAPYFHDGKVATLPEAVRLMAWHQLGKELEPGEIDAIVTFLASLTGTIDRVYTAKPELP